MLRISIRLPLLDLPCGFVCRTRRHCSLLCHLFDFPIGKATTFLGRMEKPTDKKGKKRNWNKIKMNKSVTNGKRKRLYLTFLWVRLTPFSLSLSRIFLSRATGERIPFLKVYSLYSFFSRCRCYCYCCFDNLGSFFLSCFIVQLCAWAVVNELMNVSPLPPPFEPWTQQRSKKSARHLRFSPSS